MDIIVEFNRRVADELTAVDQEQVYRDILDECYPEVSIGSITFSPSRVLEELDPTAFRCGVSDYFSDGEWAEIDGETYRADEVQELKEEMVEDLDSEISNIETQIEDIESEDEVDQDTEELEELQEKLKELNEARKELYEHAF